MKKLPRLKHTLIVLALVLSIKLSAQATHLPEDLLIGCWTDSREENAFNSAISVYRHCDYKKFPASRFRFKMELKADGKCSYLTAGSDDRHKKLDGTWTFNKEKSLLEIKNEKGVSVEQFILLGLKEDLMEIEKK